MHAGSHAILIARRVALDTVLWYCVPAAFMAIYIRGFSLPPDALIPHFLLVAMPLAVLVLVRLAIGRLVPNSALHTAISATLLATLLSVMLLYYVLVIAGLLSWGGVISWNVIPSYARQAPAYVATLGLAPALAAAAAALMFAAVVIACWTYLRRFDWTAAAARSMSGRVLAALQLCGAGILTASAYNVTTQPWTRESEPVSLTLFRDPMRAELQGHAVDSVAAASLDRREAAVRAAYAPAAPSQRRNLVLIVIDAQRPDHMSLYGYARETTPHLDQLARTRDVRKLEFVHSSCPDTACGMLSLSSSKFPRQFSFRPFTLQQVMRSNGYRVHMILGGDHTKFYGLREFYGEVDTFYDGSQAAGYFMNDDQLVLDRLAAMPDADGTPTMFQFHLMSTHMLGKHDDAAARFQPARSYVLRFHDSDVGAGSTAEQSATNYYDNGVRKSDRMVGALLDLLEAKGYLRNTLVAITADHGEGLGEHGMFVHMNGVREEVLRIPLLFIAHGYTPELPLLPRPAPSQVDIAPTLLTELGLPIPSTWQGQPLQTRQADDFIYFEGSQNFGLIDRRNPARIMKYWANGQTGSEHAFDLSADPHEQRDLLANVTPDTLLAWRARVVAGTPL
ncbi:MAG: sulfatase-like hydrolase/transferase, partial [Steroidobacteraceae bacterium]